MYYYDAHGNMIKMPHLQEIKWDWKDQMKEATLNASNDKAYYVYDSGGERVRKVIEKGNITEERYYLGGYEIYRKTNSSTLEVERESLFIEDGSKAIAQIDNDSTTETIRYQYDNHLGSASLELDETGDIISYEEYHPFGTTSYRSGRSDTEVSLKRYKYVGKERDNETGLYYYGARYYADWIARWISPDPAGTVDAPSLYVYVKNNPVKLTDPSGMQTENDVNQTDPPKKEPKETFEIPEYKNESMAVDKTKNVLSINYSFLPPLKKKNTAVFDIEIGQGDVTPFVGSNLSYLYIESTGYQNTIWRNNWISIGTLSSSGGLSSGFSFAWGKLTFSNLDPWANLPKLLANSVVNELSISMKYYINLSGEGKQKGKTIFNYYANGFGLSTGLFVNYSRSLETFSVKFGWLPHKIDSIYTALNNPSHPISDSLIKKLRLNMETTIDSLKKQDIFFNYNINQDSLDKILKNDKKNYIFDFINN